MKKLAKILILCLVLAICVSGVVLAASANTEPQSTGAALPESITVADADVADTVAGQAKADVYYLVYADEAAFKADLEDGKLDGTGATAGTSGTLLTASIATNCYIYALQDLTVNTQLKLRNIAYVINLGDHKLTLGAGADIRLSAASGGGAPSTDAQLANALTKNSETFINGTIELADTAAGQYFTGRAGISMAFSHVTIKPAEGNSTTTKTLIYDNGLGSLTMDNCTIDYGGIIIADLFQWSGNCDNTGCTVASQDTKLVQTYNFNSVTYTSATANPLMQLRIGQCSCGGNFAIDRTVNVTGSSAFNGTFATQPSKSGSYGPAYYASADIQVNIYQGTLLSTNWVDTVNAFTGVSVNLLTANGSPAAVKDNTDTATNATYPYVVAAPSTVVNWRDADGNLIESTGYDVGAIPSYEVDYDTTPQESAGGKKLVGKAPAGWATEKGGAKTEITAITDGETERNYYLVLESTEYAIGVYSSEGGTLTSYYEDNDLHIANMIKTFAEGSYIKLYSNVEVDKTNRSTTVARRIFGYNDGLVFDLNGYELIHTKTGSTVKRWYTPSEGEKITFKNGTMRVVAESKNENLFFGTPSTATDGLGTIELYNVDIVTDATVADMRLGSLVMYGGSIEHTTSYVFTMGNKNEAESVASIKLYGVEINSVSENALFGLKLGTCTLKVEDDLETPDTDETVAFAEKISNHTVVLDDYNGKPCVLNADTLVKADSYSNLSRQTKITVSVSDSFIKTNSGNVLTNFGSFSWVNEDNTAADGDAAVAKENVKVSLSNVYLSNEVPVALDDAISLTTGKKKAVAHEDYKVSYGEPDAITFDANLTLYTDFILNFYIPKDTIIETIKIGNTVLFDINDPTTYEEYDENYYQVRILGITPNTAAKYIEMQVSYEKGVTLPGDAEATTLIHTATLKYSVINYAADLFAKQDTINESIKEESVDAMKAILAYVDASYTYFADNSESDEILLERLATLISDNGVEDYMAGITPAVHEGDKDLDGVVAAFKVDTVTKLYIKAEGTVTVKKEDGTAVALSASDDDAYDYMVSFRACDLCKTYTIAVEGQTIPATFSFGEYAAELEGASDELTAILKAMYAYGNAASELRAAMKDAGLIEQ